MQSSPERVPKPIQPITERLRTLREKQKMASPRQTDVATTDEEAVISSVREQLMQRYTKKVTADVKIIRAIQDEMENLERQYENEFHGSLADVANEKAEMPISKNKIGRWFQHIAFTLSGRTSPEILLKKYQELQRNLVSVKTQRDRKRDVATGVLSTRTSPVQSSGLGATAASEVMQRRGVIHTHGAYPARDVPRITHEQAAETLKRVMIVIIANYNHLKQIEKILDARLASASIDSLKQFRSALTRASDLPRQAEIALASIDEATHNLLECTVAGREKLTAIRSHVRALYEQHDLLVDKLEQGIASRERGIARAPIVILPEVIPPPKEEQLVVKHKIEPYDDIQIEDDVPLDDSPEITIGDDLDADKIEAIAKHAETQEDAPEVTLGDDADVTEIVSAPLKPEDDAPEITITDDDVAEEGAPEIYMGSSEDVTVPAEEERAVVMPPQPAQEIIRQKHKTFLIEPNVELMNSVLSQLTSINQDPKRLHRAQTRDAEYRKKFVAMFPMTRTEQAIARTYVRLVAEYGNLLQQNDEQHNERLNELTEKIKVTNQLLGWNQYQNLDVKKTIELEARPDIGFDTRETIPPLPPQN